MHPFKMPILPTLLIAISLGACKRATGTEPHDMSADQHQAMASQEEAQAANHSSQHDTIARELQQRCSLSTNAKICWTETINPTKEHQKIAQKHKELASEHRAASQALQDAEANACAGLSEDDRDMSPFAHHADIRSVTKLQEEKQVANSKAKITRTVGATIVFRAVPGLTAEWLQRVINCHLARNAAVGHDMPEMSYCPLVPKGVQATVRSIGDGFAVDVYSDDEQTAAEIWRRAQQITPMP
jgi:hypothetical protein